MIQLFDVYNQESQDLHYSLTAAGLSDLAVVIEPDGFLPDGVVSPFTYYLGYDSGKPLYFNQVPVPEFWEIAGDNQSAIINNLCQERAVIYYADGLQARLVKKVEWKTPAGRIFQVDHYNRFGACFAKTTYDILGQAIMTSYRDVAQKEVVLENHVTGDILLTLEGQGLRHFSDRVVFVIDFLQGLKVNLDHLLFNTLSTSFLTSYHFPEKSGQDILVWQEPLQDHIPGNMQLILENDQLRAKTIIIPDYATYERALQLTDEKFHHKFNHLGYHYQFKRDNFVRPDALIVTNSDQLEQVEKLVESLPRVTFRIAAVTEMSAKLMDMLRYHKFTSGAGWAYDYGTSDDSKEMFEYLKGYSPVHNVKEGTCYPATLIFTGDHDDRVVPAHSFKFGAELQEKQSCPNPILIRIEMNAGHGAGRSTDQVINENADLLSFGFYEMGIRQLKK